MIFYRINNETSMHHFLHLACWTVKLRWRYFAVATPRFAEGILSQRDQNRDGISRQAVEDRVIVAKLTCSSTTPSIRLENQVSNRPRYRVESILQHRRLHVPHGDDLAKTHLAATEVNELHRLPEVQVRASSNAAARVGKRGFDQRLELVAASCSRRRGLRSSAGQCLASSRRSPLGDGAWPWCDSGGQGLLLPLLTKSPPPDVPGQQFIDAALMPPSRASPDTDAPGRRLRSINSRLSAELCSRRRRLACVDCSDMLCTEGLMHTIPCTHDPVDRAHWPSAEQ